MVRKDCKGLACPQPVLAAKELMEQHPKESIEIIVDNEAAKINVTRFLESQGMEVEIVQDADGSIHVTGTPGEKRETEPDACEVIFSCDEGRQKILVFVPSDQIGTGEKELGIALMGNFLKTLKELGPDLWRLVFLNAGVKLTTKGSPHIQILEELEAKGVSILVCGTCLEFYGLMDQKAVGETTNMLDIVTSMQLATKIIRV